MSIQATIQQRLAAAFPAEFVEVVNESGQHNVPPGSESHFKVTLVSTVFQGKQLLERHRLVYAALADELSAKKIHALALHTYTADEWRERIDGAPQSPPCRGGTKGAAR